MSLSAKLPAAPGTYVLLVRLDTPLALTPGKLGEVVLPAGVVAYVGSAHGPGGLRARLLRHLRRDKPAHWHVDALTAAAPVVEIWLRVSGKRLECGWARALASLPGAAEPARGFGSSDCTCRSHLLALPPGGLAAGWAALGEPERISLPPR